MFDCSNGKTKLTVSEIKQKESCVKPQSLNNNLSEQTSLSKIIPYFINAATIGRFYHYMKER